MSRTRDARRRRSAGRAAAFIALALALVAGARPLRAQQDWKPGAIASFDEVWQTVADTFYDPAFGGLDWPGVRAELRPKAEAADSPDAVRRVITEMLGRLKRSHFVLMSGSGSGDDVLPGVATVSIDVRVVPAGVVIVGVDAHSTAERAGLRPGQIVFEIDGHPIETLTAAAQGADARAKGVDAWRRIVRALHGVSGSIATLRVGRDVRSSQDVKVVRASESGQSVTFGNLPPLHVKVAAREAKTSRHHTVGIISFNYWMALVNAPVADAVERFRHADGLVIDLRGNPGGLAAMITGMAGHLVSEPVLLGTMHMREAPLPLAFHANPRLSLADGRRVEPFSGPVAILVDELTASASECFAGALQSLGRARVFGRQSMGQALPASTKRLANGDVLMYALGDFVTATGQSLEGNGVIPDQVVPLDKRGLDALASGQDPVVDAALKWIDTPRR